MNEVGELVKFDWEFGSESIKGPFSLPYKLNSSLVVAGSSNPGLNGNCYVEMRFATADKSGKLIATSAGLHFIVQFYQLFYRLITCHIVRILLVSVL